MEISNKVVLITGASGGIGLATARLFSQKGAKLALAARSTEKLAQIVSELPNAIAIPTDMRDEQAIQHMVAHTQQHYGRIDILINNAGQGMHVPIEQANLQQYRSIFELNVVSVIAAMQAVIPIMRTQGGGVIINISSGTSKATFPGVGPYASTKYALNAISLTARRNSRPRIFVSDSSIPASPRPNSTTISPRFQMNAGTAIVAAESCSPTPPNTSPGRSSKPSRPRLPRSMQTASKGSCQNRRGQI